LRVSNAVRLNAARLAEVIVVDLVGDRVNDQAGDKVSDDGPVKERTMQGASYDNEQHIRVGANSLPRQLQ